MYVRLVALMLAAVGCGKELNPRFCRAHPEDERCIESTLDASSDVGTDVAGLVCPVSYTLTVSGSSSRYRAVNTVDDWLSAAKICADDGKSDNANTHLVVISDATELAGFAPFMDRERFVGHSETLQANTFLAVTDEPNVYPGVVTPAYPPWTSGEPNEAGTCVILTPDLSLRDRVCDVEDQAFLCECDAYPNDDTNY